MGNERDNDDDDNVLSSRVNETIVQGMIIIMYGEG